MKIHKMKIIMRMKKQVEMIKMMKRAIKMTNKFKYLPNRSYQKLRKVIQNLIKIY